MNIKRALDWLRLRLGVDILIGRTDDTEESAFLVLLRDALRVPPDEIAALLPPPLPLPPPPQVDAGHVRLIGLASCLACRHLVLADADLVCDPDAKARRAFADRIGRTILDGHDATDIRGEFAPPDAFAANIGEFAPPRERDVFMIHVCPMVDALSRRLVRSAIAEWIEDRAEALKAHRLEFWYADLEAAQAVRFRIGRAGGKYRFGTVIHMERVRDLSDEALVFKVRQECEHALQQSIRR